MKFWRELGNFFQIMKGEKSKWNFDAEDAPLSEEQLEELDDPFVPLSPRSGDDPFDVAKIRARLRRNHQIPPEEEEVSSHSEEKDVSSRVNAAKENFRPRIKSAYQAVRSVSPPEPPSVEPERVPEPPVPPEMAPLRPKREPVPPSPPRQPVPPSAPPVPPANRDRAEQPQEIEPHPLTADGRRMQFHTGELQHAPAYDMREVIMDSDFPTGQRTSSVEGHHTSESWFHDLPLQTDTTDVKKAPPAEQPTPVKEEEPPLPEEADEFFRDKKSAFALRRRLSLERRDLFLSALAALFLEGLLIWLAVGSRLPQILPEAFSPQMKPYIYLILNLLLLGLIALSGRFTLLSGYHELVARTPGFDSAVVVSLAACGLQSLLLLFGAKEVAGGLQSPYASIAGLLLTVSTLSKLLFISRTRNNFDFLCATGPKCALLQMEDEKDAILVSDGLVHDAPVIACSVPIRNVNHFLEESRSENPAERLTRKYLHYFWIASFVVAVLCIFTQKSFLQGISALALLASVSVPAGGLLLSNLPLFLLSRKSRQGRGILTGCNAIRKNTGLNGMVTEASQLFDEEGAVLHGIKTFGGTRVDEAILQTAAVIYAANSPMQFVFNQILDGRSDILPKVERLVYEDGIGLSAWVDNKRILVGNKELMRHHSVVCPTKNYEEKYRQRGRHIVYLAVEGMLSGMFVISYRPSPFIQDKLQRLTRLGVNILVNSTDPSITSEYLADLFALPIDSIRVLSADGGKICRRFIKKHTGTVPSSGIVSNGSLPSYLDALLGVARLNVGIRLSTLIQGIAVLLGFLLLGLIAAIGGLSGISPLHMLLFEGLWLSAVLVASVARRA